MLANGSGQTIVDETLFVKHFHFACQAKCLTVWPCHKTLFANISNSLVKKFDHLVESQNIACQTFLLA